MTGSDPSLPGLLIALPRCRWPLRRAGRKGPKANWHERLLSLALPCRTVPGRVLGRNRGYSGIWIKLRGLHSLRALSGTMVISQWSLPRRTLRLFVSRDSNRLWRTLKDKTDAELAAIIDAGLAGGNHLAKGSVDAQTLDPRRVGNGRSIAFFRRGSADRRLTTRLRRYLAPARTARRGSREWVDFHAVPGPLQDAPLSSSR